MAKSTSLWNEIRRQGQQILRAVQSEIAGLEQQLESLRREADRWRAVLQGRATRALPKGLRPKAAGGGRGAAGAKRRAAVRRTAARRGPSVDWDAILKKLPRTFTSADLEKSTPALKARPKARVMALARWSKGKAIVKIESGKYRKA
jgi:hypothetical protein